jgi:hypothetical protein
VKLPKVNNGTNEIYQIVTTPTRICIEVIQTIVSNMHENVHITKLNKGVGINLWHQHLGNLGVEDVKLLMHKNLVKVIIMRLQKNLTFCKGYVYGKKHKELFTIE